jgi:chitodextrinase
MCIYNYVWLDSGESHETLETYKLPVVNSVDSIVSANTIKLTVDATKGSRDISKYYYSSNNGSSYVNSTSNTYTFTGLNDNQNYNVKVYVEDLLGNASVIYSGSSTTYKKPVANSMPTSSVATTSFKVTLNATKGTGDMNKYYFSSNNGSSYVSSATNTYTFTGLTQDTTYNIKGYVEDSLGSTSNILSGTVKTLFSGIKCDCDNTTTSSNGNYWASQGWDDDYYCDDYSGCSCWDICWCRDTSGFTDSWTFDTREC